jgi:hypothetical protein
MWNYVVTGVVHPERAIIDIKGSLPLQIAHPEAAIDVGVHLSVLKSQVTIGITSAERLPDLYTLRNVISEVVSDVINCAAIEAVVAYEVELRSVHCVTDGSTLVYSAGIPGIGVKDDEQLKMDVTATVEVSGRIPLLRRALSDFKSAISHPADTGFFCYRSIECLVNFMKDEKGRRQ